MANYISEGGKGMKKVARFLLPLLLLLSVSRVRALEYEYSDWSVLYPDGIMPKFIESEDRYHFYKPTDDGIEYIDEYYTELEGYTKDEASITTFYRYITNDTIIMDQHNEIVYDLDYCDNHFCYTKMNPVPAMIDLSDKQEQNYPDIHAYVDIREASPMTGDNIIVSFGILACSLISIVVLYVIKKKRKIFN